METNNSIQFNTPDSIDDNRNSQTESDIEKEIDIEMGKYPDRWSGKVDPIDKRYVVTLGKERNMTAVEILKELVQAHKQVNKSKKRLDLSSDLNDLNDSFEMIRNIFIKVESVANSALIDAHNANINEMNIIKNEVESLKMQIDELKLLNRKFEDIKNKQTDEIKDLKEQLNDKKAEVKKMSIEFEDNEKTLLSYRRWLENAENKTKELESQISILTHLGPKNVQLEEELHNKSRTLKDTEYEMSRFKQELEHTKTELEQRKALIDELKTIIAAKDMERDKTVFEATKHLEIKVGLLEAQLNLEQEKYNKSIEAINKDNSEQKIE